MVDDGGWFTKTTRGNSGLASWKNTNSEIVLVKLNCVFSIRGCSRVRFWEDTWCGEHPLSVSFPNLFWLTNTKGAKVVDLWDSSRGDDVLSPSFSRPFNDLELGDVHMFLNLINNKRTLRNCEMREAKNAFLYFD